MKKKILFTLTILAIILAIWYLESIKAKPAGISGSPQSATPIALPVTSGAAISSASGTTPQSRLPALSELAAVDKKQGYPSAIEFSEPSGFINTDRFSLSDLVGKKVILVDFWTYSCINCIRTLPYLKSWDEKYKEQGLEIVGVHTPEFDFEKNYDNVKAAVQKYGIQYPVVLDSDYGTWQAYGNLYWPHEYLIDIAGYIVHDHVGEGGYDETETEIRKLLKERAVALGISNMAASVSSSVSSQSNISGVLSPETYFGALRNESLANGTPYALGPQTIVSPTTIEVNRLYLVGDWDFSNEYAANVKGGEKIIFKYHSAKVYFVASATKGGAIVEVVQDGVPVKGAAGSDVQDGKMAIKESRLYNVINNPDDSGEHVLELIIDSPGLQAYTFTFG